MGTNVELAGLALKPTTHCIITSIDASPEVDVAANDLIAAIERATGRLMWWTVVELNLRSSFSRANIPHREGCRVDAQRQLSFNLQRDSSTYTHHCKSSCCACVSVRIWRMLRFPHSAGSASWSTNISKSNQRPTWMLLLSRATVHLCFSDPDRMHPWEDPWIALWRRIFLQTHHPPHHPHHLKRSASSRSTTSKLWLRSDNHFMASRLIQSLC